MSAQSDGWAASRGPFRADTGGGLRPRRRRRLALAGPLPQAQEPAPHTVWRPSPPGPNQSKRSFFLVIQTYCKHLYSFLGPYVNVH